MEPSICTVVDDEPNFARQTCESCAALLPCHQLLCGIMRGSAVPSLAEAINAQLPCVSKQIAEPVALLLGRLRRGGVLLNHFERDCLDDSADSVILRK